MLKKYINKTFWGQWFIRSSEFSRHFKRQAESIVIYQMGKVGSSSIKSTLKHHKPEANLFQVHALTHERIKFLMSVYKNEAKVTGKPIIHPHLIESAFLRKKLDRQGLGEKWKIITLVRDPVARNMSSFFQSFDQFHPKFAQKLKRENLDKEACVEELIDLFLREFDHDMPLRWFDAYFKPVFGFDLLETPFDVSKGYTIVENEQAQILLIRLESMKQCITSAFDEFFGIKDVSLINKNVASGKDYSQAYSKFRHLIQLPESYLDQMYGSKFANHFYDSDELKGFRDKWFVSSRKES